MAKISTNVENQQNVSIPFNYSRGNPIPLDNSSIFNTKAEAEEYASNSPIAFVGQCIITIYDDDGTTVKPTAYIIADESGTIKKIQDSEATWKSVIENNSGNLGLLSAPKIVRTTNGTIVELAPYAINLNYYNESNPDEYSSLTLNKNIIGQKVQASLYYYDGEINSNIGFLVNSDGPQIVGKPLIIENPVSSNNATTKEYVDNKINEYITYDESKYLVTNLSSEFKLSSFGLDNAKSYGFVFSFDDFLYYNQELNSQFIDYIEINNISIKSGNSGNGINDTPVYCLISEYVSNNEINFVGISNEKQTNVANTNMLFTFNNIRIYNDKKYLISFVANILTDYSIGDFEYLRLSKVRIPSELTDTISHEYISGIDNGVMTFSSGYTGNYSIEYNSLTNKFENVKILDHNISETVHTFGSEDIYGNKTFKDDIIFKSDNFVPEFSDSILDSYNYIDNDIKTTDSILNVDSIPVSSIYENIRPYAERMFDSTTVVLQVKINTDSITPIQSTSGAYSTDQKRLIQFQLWNAGSFYVTALNTDNHSANPNKISTRMSSRYNTPIEFPDDKKLMIVWRFTHNSNTSMTIESFNNGVSVIDPITVSGGQIAKSINAIIFRDKEESQDWTIERFTVYDRALTNEEIKKLTFYDKDKIGAKILGSGDGVFQSITFDGPKEKPIASIYYNDIISTTNKSAITIDTSHISMCGNLINPSTGEYEKVESIAISIGGNTIFPAIIFGVNDSNVLNPKVQVCSDNVVTLRSAQKIEINYDGLTEGAVPSPTKIDVDNTGIKLKGNQKGIFLSGTEKDISSFVSNEYVTKRYVDTCISNALSGTVTQDGVTNILSGYLANSGLSTINENDENYDISDIVRLLNGIATSLGVK